MILLNDVLELIIPVTVHGSEFKGPVNKENKYIIVNIF